MGSFRTGNAKIDAKIDNKRDGAAGNLVTGGDSDARAYLQSAVLNQKLSRSVLASLGADAISAAVGSDRVMQTLLPGLLDLARGGSPDMTPFNKFPLGKIDIVAGAGGRFVANKPTTMVFGEAGEEVAEVRRTDGQGYQGSGGGGNYFTFNVNALDPRSFAQWLEREGKQVIINMLRSESQRGREMIFNSGLIAAPTV